LQADYTKVSHTDAINTMTSTQEISPGFQYNLNPNYRREPNWRLGAHATYTRVHDTIDGDTATNSWWSYGGEISYTLPFGRAISYFGGVGYDYQPASSGAHLPKYSVWSLKFGIDAR
ncbi:MAG: hypothetical protein M3081_22495, partial [Gemmatimonadota bacterium]|nr:hypothetical protein [Gemmatimonadota bacterium]